MCACIYIYIYVYLKSDRSLEGCLKVGAQSGFGSQGLSGADLQVTEQAGFRMRGSGYSGARGFSLHHVGWELPSIIF